MEETGWPAERWAILGDAIAKARRAKGWDQQELADRSGNSQNTISNYERGRASRSRRVPGGYLRVASALGWHPDAPKQILSGEDPADVLAQRSLFDNETVPAGGADFEGLVRLRASGRVSSVPDLGRLSARDAEQAQSGFLAQDVFVRQAKRYRKLQGLTIEQVAEASQRLGGSVTVEDLKRWEAGIQHLRMDEGEFVAKAMGTSVEWLLGSGFSYTAPEEMKGPPTADELEVEAKAVLRRLGEVGSQVLHAQQNEREARRSYEMATSMLRAITAHQHEMERNYQYLLGRIDSLRAAAGELTIMETALVYEDDPGKTPG